MPIASMVVNTAGTVEERCWVCGDPPAEPVFFEGQMVCLAHVAPCGTCMGGWRLRGEPACGPCTAVIKPTTAEAA
jgi:hypothetical protein